MSANNCGMFIGRVGKEVETRHTQQGRAIASFSLAVRRPGKDAKGQEITDWFGVTLWGKQAELAGELVTKGALISVTGAVNVDEWTDQQGNRQKAVKINADGFQLLESKGGSGDQQPAQRSQRQPARQPAESDFFDEDDIPPF